MDEAGKQVAIEARGIIGDKKNQKYGYFVEKATTAVMVLQHLTIYSSEVSQLKFIVLVVKMK